MTALAGVEHWETAFEAARADLPDAPWLRTRRETALARFREQGFPSTRVEAWRSTSLAAVARAAFRPAPPPTAAALAETRILLEGIASPTRAPRIVLVDGHLVPSLSDLDDLPAGVEVASLAHLLAERPQALDGRLATLLDGRDHPFAALNTALWSDGVIVRFLEGADVEAPIHVVGLASGGGEPIAVHPRILYVAEAQSRGAVLETWTGGSAEAWLTNVGVEVFVGPNAHLDLLEVQDEGPTTYRFRSLAARLDGHARFASTCWTGGARLARNDVEVRLEEEGAECWLDGLTLVGGTQHVDHRTLIDHVKPHGTSHQLYKGVLSGEARAAFAGRILVRPHAQKTDARQANHSLLLSDRARADSVPQLEIFADDVKCAHGATVGQLDEDALFYLRSRGLGLEAARRLLVRGFAGEIATRVQHAALRQHLEGLVEFRVQGSLA